MGSPALQAEGLYKSFGATPALAGTSLEIAPGQIVALLGRNGAGKTTFVRCASGLVSPDAGTVEIFGRPIGSGAAARRKFGLAPQEVGLYMRLPVSANVQFFAELAGLRPAAARRRVATVMADLDLEGLARRNVNTLSGGEQRRVHAACALVHDPPLILLDEPTAGADVESRARLLAHLRWLAEGGTAICYTTHYLPEVVELDADVAILHAGQVIASGRPHELIARHGSSTAELSFEGPPPATEGTSNGDGRLTVPIRDPRRDVAAIIAGLGADVTRLRELVVRPASLDQVFRTLTGPGHEGEE